MRYAADGRGDAMDVVSDPTVWDRGSESERFVDGVHLIAKKSGDKSLRSDRDEKILTPSDVSRRSRSYAFVCGARKRGLGLAIRLSSLRG